MGLVEDGLVARILPAKDLLMGGIDTSPNVSCSAESGTGKAVAVVHLTGSAQDLANDFWKPLANGRSRRPSGGAESMSRERKTDSSSSTGSVSAGQGRLFRSTALLYVSYVDDLSIISGGLSCCCCC